jgi:tryptophan 2,3-dioxygenase
VATHEDFSEPVLTGEGESDYERYLNTVGLLALQKTSDEWVHRDELLFQTVHQSSELWLKLAWNDVEAATEHLTAGEIPPALRLLRRSTLCLNYATSQLDMLEHMSPWEYQEIRKVLGHGSGFDSPGWREIRRVVPAARPGVPRPPRADRPVAPRRLRAGPRARGALPARGGADRAR